MIFSKGVFWYRFSYETSGKNSFLKKELLHLICTLEDFVNYAITEV